MKAFIVGLLSLTVLAGYATTTEAHNPTDPTEPKTGNLKGIKAGKGVCKANKAVFVILIDSNGQATGFACNKVGNGSGGGASTKQPGLIHDHDSKLVLGTKSVDLGTLRKWVIPNTADPCYVWVVGGSRYHVCW